MIYEIKNLSIDSIFTMSLRSSSELNKHLWSSPLKTNAEHTMIPIWELHKRYTSLPWDIYLEFILSRIVSVGRLKLNGRQRVI